MESGGIATIKKISATQAEVNMLVADGATNIQRAIYFSVTATGTVSNSKTFPLHEPYDHTQIIENIETLQSNVKNLAGDTTALQNRITELENKLSSLLNKIAVLSTTPEIITVEVPAGSTSVNVVVNEHDLEGNALNDNLTVKTESGLTANVQNS